MTLTDAELQQQLMLWKSKTTHYAAFVRMLIEEVIESRKYYRGAVKR